jgi:hypothetical protein
MQERKDTVPGGQVHTGTRRKRSIKKHVEKRWDVKMGKFLSKLGRFKWSLHNLVAHPLSELIYLVGFEKISNWIHDITLPEHSAGTGRG